MKQRIPVSVVILTKNEEANIGRAVSSVVEDFAEVIVVDSSSEDATAERAIQAGARVVQFKWNGGYPKKKEWARRHVSVSSDWVLLLDADEVVPAATTREIDRAICEASEEVAAYRLSYRQSFGGRVLRHGYRTEKIALYRPCRVKYLDQDGEVDNMWEVEGHYQPIVDGRIGSVREPIDHVDNKPMFDLIGRHNRYSDWEAATAKSEFDEARTPRTIAKRAFRRSRARGVTAFAHSYVLKFGFLDGWPGFDYAVFRGFYYWQIAAKRRLRED